MSDAQISLPTCEKCGRILRSLTKCHNCEAMSETPFHVLPSSMTYWGVYGPGGRLSEHPTEHHARSHCKVANHIWSAAGGPALTRQRDELLYLLTEVANSGVEIELPRYRTVQIDNVTWDRIAAAIGGGA